MNFSDNHKKLYNIILSHSGLSFSELLEETQFDRAILMQLIDDLEENDLIYRSGCSIVIVNEDSPGDAPEVVQPFRYYVCIDPPSEAYHNIIS